MKCIFAVTVSQCIFRYKCGFIHIHNSYQFKFFFISQMMLHLQWSRAYGKWCPLRQLETDII